MDNKNDFGKNISVFFVSFVIAILFFTLDQKSLLNGTKSSIFSTLRPVMQLSNQGASIITRPIRFLANYAKEQDELGRLRKQMLDLISLQTRMTEVEKENIFLKNALSIKQKSKKSVIVAKIIGKSSEIDPVTILNVGSEDGLVENEIILLPDNFLFGKIVKVYKNISQAQIITNHDFSIRVRGQKTRVDAICRGAGDHLELEIIDYRAQPEIGETFITTGTDDYMNGLIVGQLTEIIKNPSAISRIGILKLFINPDDTEQVLVLKND
jgi:rod shape-determining protein MreC